MALNDGRGEHAGADGTDGTEVSDGVARPVAAFRGAVGFTTRLPVGHRESDWAAFRATPVALPLAGYLVGALLALPFVLLPPVGVPPAVVSAAFLAWVYLLTGINHVDGLADLGDAAVVHGDQERRLAVLKDTTVGVGALLAVGLVLAALALAGLSLAGVPAAAPSPLSVVGIVVAAEVGAKLGMVVVAAFGTAATDGLGAELSGRIDAASLAVPAAVALPAAAVAWPSPAGVAALLAPVLVALGLWRWARANLGGVNGDVMGAANELGRLAALLVGVVAWTHW